jgi:predicted lipoprotein with Yx(FWY)xxD motif
MESTGINAPSRTRRKRLVGGLAVLVAGGIGLIACSSNGTSSGNYGSPTTPPPTRAPVTTPPSTPATVSLASNATIGQKVLVDAHGRTVYLFVPDGTSTMSTVPAEFKPNWPPVTAMGMPDVGSALDSTKLGVAKQTDGTQQVTYNGHLLYTFINDKAPGDANGQALGPNNWFVLGADGNPIGMPSTVSLADNATIGQKVLVDANGMTLYLFVPDGTGTQTQVPAEFKPNWPQLTANGAPTAATGLDATKLGVAKQTDGTQQVTYNGHLLYTFINDKAPGDANGQGLGPNAWFVLDADGNPIGMPPPPPPKAPAKAPAGGMHSNNGGGW